MTLAEAVSVVRDQLIPALQQAYINQRWDQRWVEALRVLLADAETTLAAEARERDLHDQIMRCEVDR